MFPQVLSAITANYKIWEGVVGILIYSWLDRSTGDSLGHIAIGV